MPFVAPDQPPAHVQEQGPEEKDWRPRIGALSDRTDRSVPLSPLTDLTLHGLHEHPDGVGIEGLSLSTRDLRGLNAAPLNTAPLTAMPSTQPGNLFSANIPAPLKFTTHSQLERALVELGIYKMHLVVKSCGDDQRATIVTDGTLLSQRFDLTSDHASWVIHGEPINEFFNHITNGASTFSGVTLYTNGKQFDLSPSVTINSVIPGVTTTLSSRVGEAFSLTEGLRPTIGDGFLGEPLQARDPIELGEGRLFINSYQFPHNSGALATRLDFVHEGHHSSLLLATGMGEGNRSYNIVGLRGSHLFSNGLTAEADALYKQLSGGMHALGGELTFRREGNSSFFEVGIGGRHNWQSQGGASDLNIPSILGTPQTGYEVGFRLEWRG